MWEHVGALQKTGVTIILTTHYLEEAQEMADRVGVINHGEIIITENKNDLMKKMGRKQLILDLKNPLTEIPAKLSPWSLKLNTDRTQLTYMYDSAKEDNGIAKLLAELSLSGVSYKDIHTKEDSLEEIFIELVKK